MDQIDFFENPHPTPIVALGVFPGNRRLFTKRTDLTHPQVSGNKWYKLKYNIKKALANSAKGVVTFGGAFSNHLYATAAAGFYCGLPTIGLVRGEVKLPLNPTLSMATRWNMELIALSRSEYASKNDPIYLRGLQKKYAGYYFIPEGGTNQLAIQGCREMVRGDQFDFCCLSCGTGGTLAGVALELPTQTEVIGFPALKGGSFLEKEIQDLLHDHPGETCSWRLMRNYHFGGYAKINDQLATFIKDFNTKYHIQLDPIYTGKMMFGVFDLLKKDYFPEQSNILVIHSGGLQGIEGIREKYGNNII